MKLIIAAGHSLSARFLRGQLAYLRSASVDVILVAADGKETRALANSENVKFLPLPFRRDVSPFWDALCFWRICWLLMKEKPDLVNVGSPKAALLFMLAAPFFRSTTKFIFTLRTIRHITLRGLKRNLVRFLEKLSATLADHVIVISPSLRDFSIESGLIEAKKCSVIGKGSSNGVDISYFSPQVCATPLHNLWPSCELNSEEFVVGFAGRLAQDKGLDILCAAVQKLNQEGRIVRLLVAGVLDDADPIDEDLYRLIQDNRSISYLGDLSDMRPFYCSLNLLVLPSYREGFGNVVIEAAAMRRPAIVSDIPGARDTIVAFRTGIHFPAGDIQKLSDSIAYYLDNPWRFRRHSRQAEQRAKKYFDSRLIWKGQLDLYRSVLGNADVAS